MSIELLQVKSAVLMTKLYHGKLTDYSHPLAAKGLHIPANLFYAFNLLSNRAKIQNTVKMLNMPQDSKEKT